MVVQDKPAEEIVYTIPSDGNKIKLVGQSKDSWTYEYIESVTKLGMQVTFNETTHPKFLRSIGVD